MNNLRNFLYHINLCLVFFSLSFANEEECDKSKCPGPLRFYDDVHCKPIYKNPGDCCAVKYDCSHLEGRSKSKCYANGNVYEIGERLKEEDRRPCDMGCYCEKGFRDIVNFRCLIVDCYFERFQRGCYTERNPNNCCPGDLICPKEYATCLVDGKVLREGDSFKIKGKPLTTCFCKPGYKGENVEPFCYTKIESYCGTEMNYRDKLIDKCAPIYHYQESLQRTCTRSFRCQSQNETLIPNPENIGKPTEDQFATCTLGTIKMKIGDELSPVLNSGCTKCKCEVPPTPTCLFYPNENCNMTEH